MNQQKDWWVKNLEYYRQCGRDDAERGEFHLPNGADDRDPDLQEEDWAYREGFRERRLELSAD